MMNASGSRPREPDPAGEAFRVVGPVVTGDEAEVPAAATAGGKTVAAVTAGVHTVVRAPTRPCSRSKR